MTELWRLYKRPFLVTLFLFGSLWTAVNVSSWFKHATSWTIFLTGWAIVLVLCVLLGIIGIASARQQQAIYDDEEEEDDWDRLRSELMADPRVQEAYDEIIAKERRT